jgi:hypothetical protein
MAEKVRDVEYDMKHRISWKDATYVAMEAAKRGPIRVEPSPDDDSQRRLSLSGDGTRPERSAGVRLDFRSHGAAVVAAIEKGAPPKATVANLAKHDENTCGNGHRNPGREVAKGC